MLADLRPRWVAYLLALCITAVVLLGREAVAGFLGRSDPFLPFVGAVLIASWFGGLGPGLLATALGAMATDFFLVAPFFSLPFAKLVHGADLLLFVVLGVLISLLSDKRLRLVCQLWEADCRKNRFLATLAPASATRWLPLPTQFSVSACRSRRIRKIVSRSRSSSGRRVRSLDWSTTYSTSRESRTTNSSCEPSRSNWPASSKARWKRLVQSSSGRGTISPSAFPTRRSC